MIATIKINGTLYDTDGMVIRKKNQKGVGSYLFVKQLNKFLQDEIAKAVDALNTEIDDDPVNGWEEKAFFEGE